MSAARLCRRPSHPESPGERPGFLGPRPRGRARAAGPLPSPRHRLAATSSWFLVLLTACGFDRGVTGEAFSERIEDGVVIAENAGLDLADTTAWSIDTTNVVRIGLLDGPEEYVIGQIAGMLRRPDGSILVADQLSYELRLFDREGRFLRRIGRQGDGPGEFGRITKLVPYRGDSVAVFTGAQVSVLDADLEFVRRFLVRLQETRATPPFTSDRLVDVFAGGGLLMSDFLNACGPSRTDGFCEDSVAFFATDEAGATAGRFGRFVYERRQSMQVLPGLSTGWSEPHPQAIWRVQGERFYYADARRFEIQIFLADGALERIVRVAATAPRYGRDQVLPPPRSAAAIDHPEAEEIARVSRESRAQVALPDSFPHFSDMLVDEGGNIWIREYLPHALAGEVAPRWFIFDAAGRLRRALRSPPGMIRPFAPSVDLRPVIGEDYVLVAERGELGVESVALYPLRKR